MVVNVLILKSKLNNKKSIAIYEAVIKCCRLDMSDNIYGFEDTVCDAIYVNVRKAYQNLEKLKKKKERKSEREFEEN